MEIQDRCFEYFRSVNPIAQKIAEDIDSIKETNKSCWNSMDTKSKEKIINEALLDSSLIEKYECNPVSEYEDLGPNSNFSWFSRSQLNLFSHINVRPEKNKTPLKKSDVLSPPRKTKCAPNNGADNSGKNVKNKSSKDEKICSKGVAKPKTPPPPPPAKLALSEQRGLLDGDLGDDIPKTGFDFLDNW